MYYAKVIGEFHIKQLMGHGTINISSLFRPKLLYLGGSLQGKFCVKLDLTEFVYGLSVSIFFFGQVFRL